MEHIVVTKESIEKTRADIEYFLNSDDTEEKLVLLEYRVDHLGCLSFNAVKNFSGILNGVLTVDKLFLKDNTSDKQIEFLYLLFQYRLYKSDVALIRDNLKTDEYQIHFARGAVKTAYEDLADILICYRDWLMI